MNTIFNHTLKGRHGKDITLDVYWKEGNKPKPIIVFAHGFKGFKDWGHWSLIAEKFALQGFCFIKFNFSHNGVSPQDLLNFADLEAFGNNNYSIESDDLKSVLNWIAGEEEIKNKTSWDQDNITLIGHSRGGPIAVIAAAENNAVKQLITWASVHELNYSWHNSPEHISSWKKEGVHYIMNGRTKQNMPLYYQLFENYSKNKIRFSVKSALLKLRKPYLIMHGSEDPAVPLSSAKYLARNSDNSELYIIENANHVFGGSHPFKDSELPAHSKILTKKCIEFIQKHSPLR